MIKNKQGMSAVVTTLIIILLVLVALGIIWVVVRNLVQGGAEQVGLSQKCQEVEITAVKINETSSGVYSVTLRRTGSGDEIGGVRVVLSNGVDYSDVLDFGIALGPLETKTNSSMNAGISGANEIQVTPYFISDLGEVQLCQNTVTTEF